MGSVGLGPGVVAVEYHVQESSEQAEDWKSFSGLSDAASASNLQDLNFACDSLNSRFGRAVWVGSLDLLGLLDRDAAFGIDFAGGGELVLPGGFREDRAEFTGHNSGFGWIWWRLAGW